MRCHFRNTIVTPIFSIAVLILNQFSLVPVYLVFRAAGMRLGKRNAGNWPFEGKYVPVPPVWPERISDNTTL
jgi:hypothetical protein